MDNASPRERSRNIIIEPLGLEGMLGLPESCVGIVLFAHGSGSGRFSPRNNFVARALREAGIATLLFDLLTEEEAQDRRNVFDIPLLADRLLMAIAWVQTGSRDRAAAGRLFRRQYRCGRSSGRGGLRDMAHRSDRVAGRPPRPRRVCPCQGHCTDLADRRRRRSGGP